MHTPGSRRTPVRNRSHAGSLPQCQDEINLSPDNSPHRTTCATSRFSNLRDSSTTRFSRKPLAGIANPRSISPKFSNRDQSISPILYSRGQPMAIRLWRTSGKATEEVAAGTRKRITKATESSASVRDRGHGGNHPQPSRSQNPMLLRREANKQTN
jgi:hypothetical protein